ncbi:DUF6478 family protein [Yoonia sp. R2331]|uniref:DUF6478 family protein n=1 Tax=Yoonia sp. R2331 TaxID=3237238 RepID=UPI0034E44804
MARNTQSLLDRISHRRSLRRWTAAARAAETAELSQLKDQRQQARQLKGRLDQLVHVADGRLALPRIGSNAFNRPGGTLWSWRPQVWRGPVTPKGIAAVPSKTPFGDEMHLFHDCSVSELTMRQLRNTREEDLAPFALRMDVFGFDGSFLSLVLNFPKDAVDGMRRRHLIRVSTIIEAEKEVEVFGRLNVKHGPNTEQVTLEIPINLPESVVEFDLAYSELNEKRIDKMWLDLIFEGPEMNQITMRDLTFCRYPRAEL